MPYSRIRYRKRLGYSDVLDGFSYLGAWYNNYVVPAFWQWGYLTPKTPSDPSYPPVQMVTKLEEFWDDLDSLKEKVNACKHQVTTRTVVSGYVDCPALYSVAYWGRAAPSQFVPPIAHYIADLPMGSTFGRELEARCLEKVLADRPEKQAMQSLPFLYELHQAVDMIRRPWSFLTIASGWAIPKSRRKVFYDSRGRRRREIDPSYTLKDHLRYHGLGTSSSGWLQYRYGWLPLISDLQGFASAMGGFKDDYDLYRSQQNRWVKFKKVLTDHTESNFELPDNPASMQDVNYSGSAEHRARCALQGMLRPTGETMGKCDFVRHKLGLSNIDLLTAAWEVIPYSFVLDWVIPVGDALRKITETPCDIQVHSRMYDYTIKSKRNWVLRTSLAPICAGPSWGYVPLATDETVHYQRDTLGIVGSPEPLWMTTKRVLDALGLITTALKLPIPKKNGHLT